MVGDVHGNTVFMRSAIERASSRGINTMLQVGDFGYWPHTKSGVNFLNDVERFGAEHNVTVWWIDGNHENHEWLGLKDRLEDETVAISEHCRYLPRGHRWEWEGVRFGALGGAFSIDWRVCVPMVSWWPQEVVHLRDVDRLGSDPLDVLVTHDHPAGFDLPTDFSLRPADQAVSDEQRFYSARHSTKQIHHSCFTATGIIATRPNFVETMHTRSLWKASAVTATAKTLS